MSKPKRGKEDEGEEAFFTMSHEISEEERLEKIFEQLDTDHNGKIDITELSEALKGSKFGQQYAEVCIEFFFHINTLLDPDTTYSFFFGRNAVFVDLLLIYTNAWIFKKIRIFGCR